MNKMNLKTIINSFDLAIKLKKEIFMVADGVMYIGTPSKKDEDDDYYQNLINAMLLDVEKSNSFDKVDTLFLKDVSIIGNYERVNVDIVAIDVQTISAVSFSN
ncbi:hypothetical protein ACW7GW_09235 [Staphylococcus capitis subsp. urealyticus]